jgi:hypothetical protein
MRGYQFYYKFYHIVPLESLTVRKNNVQQHTVQHITYPWVCPQDCPFLVSHIPTNCLFMSHPSLHLLSVFKNCFKEYFSCGSLVHVEASPVLVKLKKVITLRNCQTPHCCIFRLVILHHVLYQHRLSEVVPNKKIVLSETE